MSRPSPSELFRDLCAETIEVETEDGEAYIINLTTGEFAGSGITKTKILTLRIADRRGCVLHERHPSSVNSY